VPLLLREENVSSPDLKSWGRCAPFFSHHARLMMFTSAAFSTSTGVGAAVSNSTVKVVHLASLAERRGENP